MNPRIFIVGGSGFVGYALAKKLQPNYIVFIMDIVEFKDNSTLDSNFHKNSQIQFIYGDITKKDILLHAIEMVKPDAIICLVGYGMSGSAMLDLKKCNDINYVGILNLIGACKEKNICRLIYTSTYNVIFGGQRIENGNEDLPYYPIDKHTDGYSPSKARAEQAILDANYTLTNNNVNRMITSVIRPAAIYGKNEQRHFPRIVRIMDLGLFLFRIGQPIVDWVHIDNLTQAYECLLKRQLDIDVNISIITGRNQYPHPNQQEQEQDSFKTKSCGGQVYCISDGQPIEMFEFIRPICEARGVSYPKRILSKSFMLKIGYFFEQIHYTSLLWKPLGFPSIPPFITRAEVLKSGETHYFTIDKAKKDLGYHPNITTKEGSLELSTFYRQNLTNKYFYRIPHILWWISITFGMGMLYLFSFTEVNFSILYENTLQSLKPQRNVGDFISNIISSIRISVYYPLLQYQKLSLFIFHNQKILQLVWYLAIIAHGSESVYATIIASRIGCRYTWWLWSLQTLALGYPSLSLLQEREKWIKQ